MVDMFKGFFNKKHKFSIQDHNIIYYALNGILFTLVVNLYKPFATKFIFRLGGTESHVALSTSLPGLIAVFVTIPGLILMSNASDKKKSMMRFFLGSRLFILSFALIPFLPRSMQAMAFVILSSLMNFPESVSSTALQSFSGDIFLEEVRPTAISTRNKFSTLAQIISVLIIGRILKGFSHSEDGIIMVYQIFFVLAFIISLFEIYTFNKIKETSCSPKLNINLKDAFSEIFTNKQFNIFLVCSLLFHFGWQMGWPLFSIYQIKYLGADEWWLTILTITASIIMLPSYGYWKNLIQKKGNSFVISIATLGMAATPILFALSPNLYIITITGLITGFFTAGTITALLTLLLEVTPTKNRILYIGVHVTLTNITLFLAPTLGDFILNHTNIYLALCASAFFRLIGSISFFIRNKKNTPSLD
jgi:MFS family permease